MTSATIVEHYISFRTPNRDGARSNDFNLLGRSCHLWFSKKWLNGSDCELLLCTGNKFDRSFDVSVHVIVLSNVVSHYKTTLGVGQRMIWKGDLSELIKVAPDCDQLKLLFKVFVYENTESDHSKRTTAEKCLLDLECENKALGIDSLSQDLEKLLEREDSTADVQLRCGDREFKAHGFLLSSRSEVFASMLRSEMQEGKTGRVEIRDTEADIFAHFLRYLYTVKLPKLTLETAVQLYETGDRYNVDALKAQCSLVLTQKLTPQNAWDILLLADRHSDPDLKDNAISCIVDHRIPLQEDVWQQLSTNHSALCFEILKFLCPLIPSSK